MIEEVSIGRFVFKITPAIADQGGPFVITEKGDPQWQFVVESANAVQAFLRGVMVGTERHF